MKNDELSNKIIERIDSEKIKSLPHWRFVLLRVIFWLLALLSIIIGSFAVAAMLFLFFSYRAHGLLTVSEDFTELLLLIPYIWLVVFGAFLIITKISIEHTKKGYKYRFRTVLLASVILSLVLGFILYADDIGRMTHEFFNRIPFYNSVTYDSQDIWNRPKIGRLAGVVVSIEDNNNFSIVDFSGHVWHVRLATSTSGLFVPEANSTVRMTGLLEASSSKFIAKSVVEWEE